MRVSWFLNNKCNYNCVYCCHQKRNEDINIQDVNIKYVDTICRNLLSLNIDTFDFELIGGEPTLYKDLKELVDKIDYNFKERLKYISIVTNGFRPKEYWLDFKKYKKLEVIISLHLDYFSPKYYETVDYLLNNNFNVELHIMYQPDKRELIKKIIEFAELRKDKLLYSCEDIVVNLQTNELWFEYSAEDKELLENRTYIQNGPLGYLNYCIKTLGCTIDENYLSFCDLCISKPQIKIPISFINPKKFKNIIREKINCNILKEILIKDGDGLCGCAGY